MFASSGVTFTAYSFIEIYHQGYTKNGESNNDLYCQSLSVA
jgi:hypothetical protein